VGFDQAANRHPRVNILQPGPGVGGHCIAVDPWFIVASAPDEARLISTARQVNDYKPQWVLERIVSAANAIEKETVRVACLGLAFKANIDDVRESPAIEIVNKLALRQGICVVAIEPNINKRPNCLAEDVFLSDSIDEVDSCDLVVVLVDHNDFLVKKMPFFITPPCLISEGLLMNKKCIVFCSVKHKLLDELSSRLIISGLDYERIDCTYISGGRLSRIYWVMANAIKIIRNGLAADKADNFVFHYVSAQVWLAAPLLLLLNRKVILHFWGTDYAKFSKIKPNFWIRLFFKKIALVTFANRKAFWIFDKSILYATWLSWRLDLS